MIVIVLLSVVTVIIAAAIIAESHDGRIKNRNGSCVFDGNCENCSVDEGYISWQTSRMRDSLRMAERNGYESIWETA